MGGEGAVRIGGARKGETLGSRTRRRGGCPGTCGPWLKRAMNPARFGTNGERRSRQ